MTEKHYIVAAIKSWNIEEFHRRMPSLSGTWHLITDPEDLTPAHVKTINPRYIFFPHWSDKVSAEIFKSYECVCFHMTDVPYGRGGSPLQNLIVRGHKKTKLTALRMNETMDAGPVYYKTDLPLEGTAEEILKRASMKSFDIIEAMIKNEPDAVPQEGDPVIFKRRKPEEGDIAALEDIDKIYDYIRMLDAEGYPRAFIETEHFRIELENADLKNDEIKAHATIRIKK